jgi:hypothetical protein
MPLRGDATNTALTFRIERDLRSLARSSITKDSTDCQRARVKPSQIQ